MKIKYTLSIVLVILVALGIIYAGYNSILNTDTTSATIVKTNTKISPFKADRLDGKNYKFKQSSEIVVFEGFAEWCLPCRQSVPEVLKFSKSHPEIELIGVAFRDVDFKTKEFQNKYGTFEKTIISTGMVEDALGLKGIPQTLFVIDNKVAFRVYGPSTKEDLEKVLLLVKGELPSR